MIYVPIIFEKILNRFGLLGYLRTGYRLKILNTSFKIPVIENKEGLYYHQSITERFLLSVLKSLYNQRDFLFIDVGVNFGQTLLKLKAVKRNASYIGFEPSGLCAYYVSLLIGINKFSDAKVMRCALSNEVSILSLYAHSNGDARASIIKTDTEYEEIVPAFMIDSFIPIISEIQKEVILKVDVEGAEHLVFQGGENFLREFNPVVIFENLPHGGDTSRKRQQLDISNFFLSRKYRLFLVEEPEGSLHGINILANEKDYRATNYLAIPANMIGVLNDLCKV